MSKYNELLADVKAKISEANSVLRELDDTGYGKLTVINYALKKQSKITGRKSSLRRFAIGSARDINKLEQLSHQLDLFLNSPWVSPEGREEIRLKAAKSLYARSKSADKLGVPETLTEEEALRAVDLFSTTAYSAAVEAGMVSSDELLDMIDIGYSDAEIEDALRKAAELGKTIYQTIQQ